MARTSSIALLLLLAFGCTESVVRTPSADPEPDGPPSTPSDAGATHKDASTPKRDGGARDAAVSQSANLRIMAANISSGSSSTYDSGEGIRIFQGLHPDIALVQELNYKKNEKADLDAFVATAFGASYTYFREEGAQIPNGIVSRYPILSSGTWTDPQVSNRSFVYAKIDVPGPHDLWAVSVHLLTTSSNNRNLEAEALVAKLGTVVSADDYIVVGGDFNTALRTETCLTTFSALFNVDAPYPADQDGNDFTNAPRNAPYDWVLASPELGALQVPTVIADSSYEAGLVFDSRVYTPLGDVSPIEATDSTATNMQHMPVIKDFALP